MSATIAFPLEIPAANGLMRGITTGTCATAAVKAALLQLLFGIQSDQVDVALPDGKHFVTVPIAKIEPRESGFFASVVKNAGDDPDQTHRATIFAIVRPNSLGELRFLKGEGVGIVTQPGLQIPVGEPAINPVPRQMMQMMVDEVLEESDQSIGKGFDLEIGCVNGAEIAKKTFNPRLGIEGGISILGTTGIVEPKSMAAFKASIEIYVRVALGDLPPVIVLAPGNLGQKFARASLDLPTKRIVQMSNFVGFAFDCTEQTLTQASHRLQKLWVVGHPGKLAKLLNSEWDTHSSNSGSAVPAVVSIAREMGLAEEKLRELSQSLTVERIMELLAPTSEASRIWNRISEIIARRVFEKVTHVNEIGVQLFQMDGRSLGSFDLMTSEKCS
ncbi:MAG: cobalt-precorrin-5B (C(1))-methyltransferase CbiD [Verrucomicrobiota bacterium]